MYSKKYLIIFFIFIFLWCFGIISPIIFQHEKVYQLVKPFLNLAYSQVCHQSHEKTISFWGENIFVCSRCAGIYLGIFLTGFLAIIFSTTPLRIFYFLLLSLILMFIDVSSTTIGIYNYSKSFALLTGLLSGSALLLFVLEQFNYFKKQSNYEK
jgi:uncharacterized membrane protein